MACSPCRGSVYPVLAGAAEAGAFLRPPKPCRSCGSSSPSQEQQQDGGRQGASPSPVAGCDLLRVTVARRFALRRKKVGGKQPVPVKQLFQSLSRSFILTGDGKPPSSPPLPSHAAASPSNSIPHPSLALQHLRRGRKSDTNHKKNPIPCGLFGVADLFANELGGSLGKKRACLVNPISLPQ